MTRLQALVLALFSLVTFGNVYLLQPGIQLAPEIHAAVVSTTISMFFLAFNLKRFADLDGKPDPMIVPLAPGNVPLEVAQVVAESTMTPSAPTAPAPPTTT